MVWLTDDTDDTDDTDAKLRLSLVQVSSDQNSFISCFQFFHVIINF